MSEWAGIAVRIGDGVAWTSNERRVVAMDLTRAEAAPYALEASAAAVWEEIAVTGPVAVDALLHGLAQAFEVEELTIQDDIQKLLAELVSQNLLLTMDVND